MTRIRTRHLAAQPLRGRREGGLVRGPAVLPVLIAAGLLAGSAGLAKAQLQGDAALLDLAAKEHRANRDKLRTWRGRVLVEHETSTGEAGGRTRRVTRRKATVRFACDAEKEWRRCNWTFQEDVSLQEGASVARGVESARPLETISTLLKGGAFYTFRRVEDDGSTTGQAPAATVSEPATIVRSSEAPKPGFEADAFDPLYWLRGGRRDVAETCRSYYGRHAQGDRLANAAVSRQKDEITLETVEDSAVSRYTINLAQGATLTRYEGGNADRWTVETWKHANVAGVWVPVEFVGVLTSPKIGSSDRFVLRWVDSAVNEPLGDEEFSLVTLGLRRGDRVEDRRTGRSFRITGEEFPPPRDDRQPGATPWTAGRVLPVAAAIVLMLVVVGALAVARRRRRSSGPARE